MKGGEAMITLSHLKEHYKKVSPEELGTYCQRVAKGNNPKKDYTAEFDHWISRTCSEPEFMAEDMDGSLNVYIYKKHIEELDIYRLPYRIEYFTAEYCDGTGYIVKEDYYV